MNYSDTSYMVRLYFEEPGWEEVRELRTAEPWACCLHGRAETIAAFHRKFREALIDRDKFLEMVGQFDDDCRNDEFHWLPVQEGLVATLTDDFLRLPPTFFLRAADALHLACAREHGFKTIYSNDKNLLAAAKHFGLRGKNVIK